MKVLFLDNDGVICLANNWGSRVKKRKKDNVSLMMNDPDVEVKYRFDYFDKKAVKVLNQVLEEKKKWLESPDRKKNDVLH